MKLKSRSSLEDDAIGPLGDLGFPLVLFHTATLLKHANALHPRLLRPQVGTHVTPIRPPHILWWNLINVCHLLPVQLLYLVHLQQKTHKLDTKYYLTS